jgi:hypothetical protein
MKKGQTGMEYLMTYGWAILIVIVVVCALYAMGVFTLPPKGGVAIFRKVCRDLCESKDYYFRDYSFENYCECFEVVCSDIVTMGNYTFEGDCERTNYHYRVVYKDE